MLLYQFKNTFEIMIMWYKFLYTIHGGMFLYSLVLLLLLMRVDICEVGIPLMSSFIPDGQQLAGTTL